MKKQLSKKLSSSQKAVSRLWHHYRTEKKKILSKKRLPLDLKRGLLAEQREITRQNISSKWSDYREEKYSLTHHSKYRDFAFVKKLTGNYKTTEAGEKKYYKFENIYQEYYKAKRGFDEYDLDNRVQQIFKNDKVTGILVTLKVQDEDTGLIHYVSAFINREQLERLDIPIYDHVVKKAQFSKSMQDFKLKGTYLRVIYENSKSSTNKGRS
jgi:hypothetical protein